MYFFQVKMFHTSTSTSYKYKYQVHVLARVVIRKFSDDLTIQTYELLPKTKT
jgi:hypothetical protein